MKTFTKNDFISLIIKTHSDFVISKDDKTRSFTVRLRATELQSGIGNNDTKPFLQIWELKNVEMLDTGDNFIFEMWGYPPSPLNNFVDSMRFEGMQMRVAVEAIIHIVNDLREQGSMDYQTDNLKKIDVLGKYMFSQKKTFDRELIEIAKENEGKITILVLEFEKKPQLPTDIFYDNFQHFSRNNEIILGKLFSGNITATTSRITLENNSNIHPVPEKSEKDYVIELFYENGSLKAKYFDKIKQKSCTFQPSKYGIMQ